MRKAVILDALCVYEEVMELNSLFRLHNDSYFFSKKTFYAAAGQDTVKPREINTFTSIITPMSI